MVTALAILGGVVLALFLLMLFARTRTLLRANKIMENTIRYCWQESGATTAFEQDNIALEMMRDACLSAQTRDQYRISLGAIRSLSSDIVKDKQRLEGFKRELLAYGAERGWTISL